MTLQRRAKAAGIRAASAALRLPLKVLGTPDFPSQPDRILVLKPCCLGDVLMATPVVGALRERFPSAVIDFAVGQFARVIVEHNPHVNEVLDCGQIGWGKPYPASELLAFARLVRQRRYDVCFVLDRSPATQLIPLLAGVPVRVGIDSDGRGFSLTHSTATDPVRHEAELYLDALRVVGIQPLDPRMLFVPSEEDREVAAGLLGEYQGSGDGPGFAGKLVCIHPAGGENPGMTFVAKRWTPKGFAAVADRVLEEGGRVLLVGSPGEREVSAETRALIGRSDGVLDITGLTTLPQLAAVIERCDVFLGNDTGPMHLACAVGTPTVAIFGPSNPVMYPPYSPYGELIYRKVYCSPCLKDGLYRFAPDCVHECMTGIGPAEPLAAMRRAMARKAAA